MKTTMNTTIKMTFATIALAATGLVSFVARAETGTLTIKPMHCSSCVKQVTKTVCNDAVMSTWFESCKAQLIDADKEIGQLTFTTKKDVKMDAEKQTKIESALKAAGREVTLSAYKN